MTKYVWSGTNSSGERRVLEMPAANVEESKKMLLTAGFTDLQLLEDDIFANAQASFTQPARFMGEEIRVTAEDRAKLRNKPPLTLPRVILETFTGDKTTLLCVGLVVVLGLLKGTPQLVVIVVVLWLAWTALRIWFALPGIYFTALTKAKDWHRWEEVLQILSRLHQLDRFHFIHVPPVELARSHAQALAGLGRLPEALVEFQRLENQPGQPGWLHKAFLAGLYDIARQHETAIEWNIKALQENPVPALYLDLANRLIRNLKEPQRARQALAEADKGTTTDIIIPFRHRCLGMIAYQEGDRATARSELENALAIMEKTPEQPFRDGHISVTSAYLSCTLARLGETKLARQRFKIARPYLEATKDEKLLAECQRYIPN